MAVTLIIAVVPTIVILLVVAVIVLRRRRRGAVPSMPEPAVPVAAPVTAPVTTDDNPMSGLETALSAATDRSGKPLRERLDEEAGHVDELRVADDTGPLLRRALDHVAEGRAAGGHGVPGGTDADPGATPAN